jgi:hypothetical protein
MDERVLFFKENADVRFSQPDNKPWFSTRTHPPGCEPDLIPSTMKDGSFDGPESKTTVFEFRRGDQKCLNRPAFY